MQKRTKNPVLSQIFKNAHDLAKRHKEDFDEFSYKEYFLQALKAIREQKNELDCGAKGVQLSLFDWQGPAEKNQEKSICEKLEDLGFSAWEKHGYKRYYVDFCDFPKVCKFENERDHRGSFVTTDGQALSPKLMSALKWTKLYFDAHKGEWGWDTKSADKLGKNPLYRFLCNSEMSEKRLGVSMGTSFTDLVRSEFR